MRQSVEWFAENMEAELQQNDYKGGWRGCTNEYLLMRLLEEMAELFKACHEGKGRGPIIKEAADVANFAMMIADNS